MKKRENFTIDEDLMRDFEEYVASEKISKSATVEQLIKDLLNEKNKKMELINIEHIELLSELDRALTDYKNAISPLMYALEEVLDNEVCVDLLKKDGLYEELFEINNNTNLDYDYLAMEVENVCNKAKKILNKKQKSKFLLKDYLSDELNQVDKDYIIKSGIDYDRWVEENKKLNLDINRYKYLVNPNIFDEGNIYYLGDKVASKVILNPNVVFDETFGIKIVAERERLYANNNDNLRFHPEFNQFALYYFLKDYKEIEKDKVFEIFIVLYSSITEDGIYKIPSEVIEYVMNYNPYTIDEIVDKVNESLDTELREDDIVEVYKYSSDDKINFKTDLGWFLNKKFIENMDIASGLIIKGEIKIKDILTVNDIDYGYIYAKYNDIKNISIVEK